jgi:hypothetical protein
VDHERAGYVEWLWKDSAPKTLALFERSYDEHRSLCNSASRHIRHPKLYDLLIAKYRSAPMDARWAIVRALGGFDHGTDDYLEPFLRSVQQQMGAKLAKGQQEQLAKWLAVFDQRRQQGLYDTATFVKTVLQWERDLPGGEAFDKETLIRGMRTHLNGTVTWSSSHELGLQSYYEGIEVETKCLQVYPREPSLPKLKKGDTVRVEGVFRFARCCSPGKGLILELNFVDVTAAAKTAPGVSKPTHSFSGKKGWSCSCRAAGSPESPVGLGLGFGCVAALLCCLRRRRKRRN